MRSRGLVLFVILNVVVSFAVAFAVINFLGPSSAEADTLRFATVEVIITATADPDATPLVQVITATPREGEYTGPGLEVLDDTSTPDALTPTALAQNTLSPEQVEANPDLESTVTALPEGCILHTLEEGEVPFTLSERYSVAVDDILLINGLSEEDTRFLQIGQVLIIPLEGCPLDRPLVDDDSAETDIADADTPDSDVDDALTATPTPEVTATPTITPTITLAPTAVDAQVEIIDVLNPGDVTSEAVVIYNNGRTVNLQNWTLRDLDGNVYTFTDQLLFNQSSVEVFTRVGESTTIRKFWGLDVPVWAEPGDVVTLADADGVVQATLRLPAPVDLGG